MTIFFGYICLLFQNSILYLLNINQKMKNTESFTEILKRSIGISIATKCLSESILNDLDHVANIYSEQFKPKWIPVAERLPEPVLDSNNKVYYAVYCDKGWYGYEGIAWFGKGFYACEDECRWEPSDPHNIIKNWGHSQVTHWMELPEKP